MTRTVYVIGIGAGDPEHLTLQAVAAMNRVDVFFTIDKGEATAEPPRCANSCSTATSPVRTGS